MFKRRQRVVDTIQFSSLISALPFQQAKHESPGISESALQPSKGKTAKSSHYKQPPRRKKQTSASNAGRSQPHDIYENVSFHKGAASSRDEAANLHEADDMCAIYNNV